MSWVAVGVAGTGAVMGMQQAKAQKKAQEAQNMAAAAQTQYSPWSHMGAGQISTAPTQTGLEGALSGGLKGYMTGASIDGAMNKNAMARGMKDVQGGTEIGGGEAMNMNAPQDPMMNDYFGKKKQTLYNV